MDNFKQIYDKIVEYKKIIIHTHIRPDGDTYGSGFGLKYVLEETFKNKEIYIVGECIDYLEYIGSHDIIDDVVFKDALSIVVDTGSKSRVSDQRFTLSKEIIKIDHHEVVEQYGDLNYVDTTMPACALIILEFINTFDNLLLNDKARLALYTGITTDTGRFRYRGVSKKTFELTATLLTDSFQISDVYDKLYVQKLDYLKIKGYLLLNFKVKGKLAYFHFTKELIEQFNIPTDEVANLVNELSGIEGINCWALFIDYEDTIRGRIRSKEVAINEICAKFNGGGHKLAAGVNLEDEVSKDKLISLLAEI